MEFLIRAGNKKYVEYPVTSKEKQTIDITPYQWREIQGENYLLQSEKCRRYERKKNIILSQNKGDIRLKDLQTDILIEDNRMYSESENVIYKNGVQCEENSISIEEGDTFLIGISKLTFFKQFIIINTDFNCSEITLLEEELKEYPFEGFPKYKRSPRMIKRLPEDVVEISKPPTKTQMKKGSLVQVIVSPLVMVAITVIMGIVMKRGIYVFVSAITTVMTTIFSVIRFLEEKKECKEKDEKRAELYQNYLLETRKKLKRLQQQEMEAWNYNYPDLVHIEHMINNYTSRIYERNCNDGDFLTVSLGNKRSKANYTIKASYDELSVEKDELELEAKEIKNLYSYIEKKPIVVDLKKAHLGIVGEKANVQEQLQIMVAQLTFMQSYHDLQIITVFDEKDTDKFHWMRWYPHCKIRAINVSGMVSTERSRDQIIGSMHQIIKERKQKRDESKKEGRFLPHFLFIIDEPKLIMDHSIMEYLEKEGDELGFSIIYTTLLQASLPEYVGTILTVNDSQSGVLVLEEKQVVNKKVWLDKVGEVQLEAMARNLSVLVHEKGIVSHIPESITFFELYGVEHPEELQVVQRWNKNESHKTLSVLLGVRAENDFVSLNLHEKAHGPHGLVAGTTGSGKSEIIQSYILSLAVNFHPYEVGFLLIDYKGGGMAGLFKNLPHLMGTITNLDGSESMRAMASIKSELARRQKIFSENGVNHINAYNKLFKAGKVEEPIPHLFLISDEFAELKKEQPDFMTELVSAARIGRSLGIHLILATQKPSGVVDDQIWTNSKFKLALKVQNEADSKEILKTADAANITQAGRAYLQVGNNEIYELFQSAWSGATYSQESKEEQADNRVYLVNDLGQGELINADLSEEDNNNQLKETQLDVTVAYINQEFAKLKQPLVRKPWMPSLEKKWISPYIVLDEIKDVSQYDTMDLQIPIGVVDIPENQEQLEYQINLLEDGNVAVFSAPGFGKSTLLTTAMLTLAVKNSPQLVQFYILDFGNSALMPLKNLPHTIDYITFDNNEKVKKLINILTQEIKRRKQLFAKESAVNFDMYNHLCTEKLPAIVLFIDNYDMIRELESDLEGFLAGLTRDGMGLGIFVMLTASRYAAVRFNVMNNIHKKIALYLYDKTETNSIVGRTNYPLAEIKGRGLVKLENVNQLQIYLSVDGETPIIYMERLKEMVEVLSYQYSGERLKPIPVLPEVLELKNFKEFLPEETLEDRIPIGLDTEKVEVQYLNLNYNKQIIVGGAQTGKTNLLKLILTLLPADLETFLVASREGELYEFQSKEQISYRQGVEDVAQLLLDLEGIIEDRKEELEEARKENPNLLAKQFYESKEHILVIIEDWDYFVELVKESKNASGDKIIAEAVAVNITFVAVTSSNKMRGIDPLTKFMKDSIYGIILGTPSEQALFTMTGMRMAKAETGIGYLYQKGESVQLRIPKMEEKNVN